MLDLLKQIEEATDSHNINFKMRSEQYAFEVDFQSPRLPLLLLGKGYLNRCHSFLW